MIEPNKARGRLRATIRPGPSHSPAELDELWTVRRDVVDFAPGKDLELDRAKITALLARATFVCTMRDSAGVAQGMWMVNELTMTADGQPCTVFLVDQWFVRKPYRGHSTNSLSILRYAMGVTPRHWHSRWFIAGVAGPMSYVFLHRWLDELWTPLDPGLPERERALLEALLEDYAASHGREGPLIPTLALMPEVPDYYRERPELRAVLERYEGFNPSWREGYALPMIGEVNLRVVRRLIGRSARRAVRGRAR